MLGDVTIVGVTFGDALNVPFDGDDSVTLNGETGGVVVSMWFTKLSDVCVTHLFVVKLSLSVTISGEWRLNKYCDVQLLESEDDESDPLGDGGNEFPVEWNNSFQIQLLIEHIFKDLRQNRHSR